MRKTLLQIWESNGESSKKINVKSPSNKTTFTMLAISKSRNHAIVYSRGKGFLGYFKKYYTTYVLDNPRWEKI